MDIRASFVTCVMALKKASLGVLTASGAASRKRKPPFQSRSLYGVGTTFRLLVPGTLGGSGDGKGNPGSGIGGLRSSNCVLKDRLRNGASEGRRPYISIDTA